MSEILQVDREPKDSHQNSCKNFITSDLILSWTFEILFAPNRDVIKSSN